MAAALCESLGRFGCIQQSSLSPTFLNSMLASDTTRLGLTRLQGSISGFCTLESYLVNPLMQTTLERRLWMNMFQQKLGKRKIPESHQRTGVQRLAMAVPHDMLLGDGWGGGAGGSKRDRSQTL